MSKGTIKFYSSEKGYGFIIRYRNGNDEFFVIPHGYY